MKIGQIAFNKDTNNADIVIDSNGRIPLIDGNDAIVQSVKTQLESNMTQWYLGYDWGTKIIQEDGTGIFQKKGITDDEILQEISRVISKYSEITSFDVTNLQRDNVNRKLYITLSVQTTYGWSSIYIKFQ